MTEQAEQRPITAAEPSDVLPNPARSSSSRATLIAWAGLSAAFITFLAFGSIGARIWRSGILYIDSRSIARIWAVQIDLLPSVSQAWLVPAAYVVSVVVFVLGVIAGLWLLLQHQVVDTDRPGESA